jgi:lipopolysaccharide biosynthesis protein
LERQFIDTDGAQGVFNECNHCSHLPSEKLFRNVCLSGDHFPNSNAHKEHSPLCYQQDLCHTIEDTRHRFEDPDERLVFISAWNDWTQRSTYLEPEPRRGYAYLEATRMALIRNTCACQVATPCSAKPIAIVIHAFYPDIFGKILKYLQQLDSIHCRLYVTTPQKNIQVINNLLSRQHHPFSLKPVNNRGRDMLPLLKILPAVIKNEHDYVLKIHTKKSPHRHDGHLWLRDLLDQLLPHQVLMESINRLDKEDHIGILGPGDHILPISHHWGANLGHIKSLCNRLGIPGESLTSLSFVAGSMFWARLSALRPLLNLALPEEAFEPETGQVDGTLAHAIERIFAVSACAAGLVVAGTNKTKKQSFFAQRTCH